MQSDEEGPRSPLKGGPPRVRVPSSNVVFSPSPSPNTKSRHSWSCAAITLGFVLLTAVVIALACIFSLSGHVVVSFSPPPSPSGRRLDSTTTPGSGSRRTNLLANGTPGSGTATPARLSIFFTKVELCQDLSLAFSSTPPSDASAFSSPTSSGCITVFSATSPLPENPTESDFLLARPSYYDVANAQALAALTLPPRDLSAFATGSFKYGLLHWEPWVLMRATVRTPSGLDCYTQPTSSNTSLLSGPARDAWIKTSGATFWTFTTPYSLPLSVVTMRGSAPLKLIFDVTNLVVAGNTSTSASLPDIDNSGFGFDAPELTVVPVPQTPVGSGGEGVGVPGAASSDIRVEQYSLVGPTSTRTEKKGAKGRDDEDENDDDDENTTSSGRLLRHTHHDKSDSATNRWRRDFEKDSHHHRVRVNVTSAPRLTLTLLIHNNAVFGARLQWAGNTNSSVFTTRSPRLFVSSVIQRDDGTLDLPPAVFHFTRLAANDTVGGACRLRSSSFATDDDEWKELSDRERGGDGRGEKRLYNYSRMSEIVV
jgi:hypothetical protein